MEEIEINEITFEIIKIRTVKGKKKEWIEIEVKVTDQWGERIEVVREGDTLKAIFERGA